MIGFKTLFIALGLLISIPSLIQIVLITKEIKRGFEEYTVFLCLYCLTLFCGVIEITLGVLI